MSLARFARDQRYREQRRSASLLLFGASPSGTLSIRNRYPTPLQSYEDLTLEMKLLPGGVFLDTQVWFHSFRGEAEGRTLPYLLSYHFQFELLLRKVKWGAVLERADDERSSSRRGQVSTPLAKRAKRAKWAGDFESVESLVRGASYSSIPPRRLQSQSATSLLR